MASSFRRFVGRVAVGALAVAVPVVADAAGRRRRTPPPTCSSRSTSRGRATTRPSRSTTAPARPSTSSAAGYVVQVYSNGSPTAGPSIALTGVGRDRRRVRRRRNGQARAPRSWPRRTRPSAGRISWNGDDAIVLRKGGASGTVVDVIGQIGIDPGTEWGTGLTSTADNTLRRKAAVIAGDTDGDRRLRPRRSSGTGSRRTPSTASVPTRAFPPDLAPPVGLRRRGPRRGRAAVNVRAGGHLQRAGDARPVARSTLDLHDVGLGRRDRHRRATRARDVHRSTPRRPRRR